MQEKLRSELQLPANSNEVQRTDITVTQQWLASNFAQIVALAEANYTTGCECWSGNRL